MLRADAPPFPLTHCLDSFVSTLAPQQRNLEVLTANVPEHDLMWRRAIKCKRSSFRCGGFICTNREDGERNWGEESFPRSSDGWILSHWLPASRTERGYTHFCPKNCCTVLTARYTQNPHNYTQALGPPQHRHCVWGRVGGTETLEGIQNPLGPIFVKRGLRCYLSGLFVTLRGTAM